MVLSLIKNEACSLPEWVGGSLFFVAMRGECRALEIAILLRCIPLDVIKEARAVRGPTVILSSDSYSKKVVSVARYNIAKKNDKMNSKKNSFLGGMYACFADARQPCSN